MDFLFDNLVKGNVPIVVGNKGWWEKGKELPLFGQQPIDIAYMCLACFDAGRVTGDKIYLDKAKFYFSWFTGNNLLKLPMLREDGACYDGLYSYGQNMNAGAESNICFLLGSVEWKNKGFII